MDKKNSAAAAALHAHAAVLCARVHSEIAYALPAAAAPQAAHALCLALDEALAASRGEKSSSSTLSSPSIFNVGARTEPDAPFVAIALPSSRGTHSSTRGGAAGVGPSSIAAAKLLNNNRSKKSASSATEVDDDDAFLVSALLRAADRLHAAVSQVSVRVLPFRMIIGRTRGRKRPA